MFIEVEGATVNTDLIALIEPFDPGKPESAAVVWFSTGLNETLQIGYRELLERIWRAELK